VETWIFVLVVFVVADGEWRDWNTYSRLDECEEVIKIITHHRESAIKARCEARLIPKAVDKTQK